jgi:hypothetical protein
MDQQDHEVAHPGNSNNTSQVAVFRPISNSPWTAVEKIESSKTAGERTCTIGKSTVPNAIGDEPRMEPQPTFVRGRSNKTVIPDTD